MDYGGARGGVHTRADEKITAVYPSSPREIADDRARTQAVLYMLKEKT